jgi:hypothetical protein
MRVWSYVYIIPQALSWSDTPDGQPFDAGMPHAAHQWVNLSFARGAGDQLLFALVLTALAANGRPKPTPRSTPIRTPDVYTGNATLPADR